MKILITGGCGYLGSHCSVQLLTAGHTVISVDNFSNSSANVISKIKTLAKSNKFKNYNVDLTNLSALNKLFDVEEQIDAVIHFAALKSVNESIAKPLKYYHNNIIGLINLLFCLTKHNIYKLIFSSSATVYGIPENLPLTENSPVDSAHPYAHTKLIAERILNDLSQNHLWQIIVLRYFNPVACHPSGLLGEEPIGIPNNLMPYLLDVATGKREVLTIFGSDYDTADGTPVRDYIHVMDLISAHIKALVYLDEHSINGMEIFNLGTGHGHSVLQMIQALEKYANICINYKYGPRRPGDVAIVYADCTKAKNLLNWQTEYTLEDICRDSWHFIQANL